MPFDTPTLPALISRAQADLGSNALRHSDAQVLARSQAGTAFGLYGYLNWIAEQILPDSADEETLERIASLRLQQPRKAAKAAAGTASFMAASGAVLDVDTVLQAGDGRSYKITTSKTTVAGSNTATLEAVDAGVLGNAEAGMTLSLVQPVEGIASAFTVEEPGLLGGTAMEGLESLRSRVIRSYRVIPHGGNKDDYETWALECPGVTRAWCVRNYMGPGTVAVFFMRNEDANPVPDAARREEVRAYIEPLRPVTAELYTPALDPVPVVYQVRLTPDTSTVRTAVEAQLADLHNREADLGEGLLISHMREAVSGARGEWDHQLIWPTADLTATPNQLLTYGGCTWLA